MHPAEPILTRSFFDLSADNNVEAEDFELLRSLSREGNLSWDQLLQADRVLIVSEAGMGKTYECKTQQKRLFDEGESAFFLELASLVNAAPESQFSPDERERFDSWKCAQTERAYFFLDSIDELKLTSASFELTLKQLATALGEHQSRACIVLTTRPGPDDRAAVERQLPIHEVREQIVPEELFADVAMRVELPKKLLRDADPRWRFVALAPLDEAQMRTLAAQQGVSDVDGMLRAIEAEHAGAFAKRPLDFIELCGGWKAHHRIPGHREQVEANITLKLRPGDDRREPADLTPDLAREGAERLAFAALLMRKFTVWHGRGSDRGRGDDALDPHRVLSDWSLPQVRSLLERGLFGFATYGRVRFHNRSVIEYLAAKRLLGLVRRGRMSPRSLNRLLFVTTPVGLELVRPTMQPVAAWLAPDLESVRSQLLRRDPSVLLQFADPGALTPALRAQALSRYVEFYGKGGWRGVNVPELQARRLASADLAPTIRALWKAGIENQEVRETLLELIEAGRIMDCADIAFEAAVDDARKARERLQGLLALAAIHDSRLSELLDRVATQQPHWQGELARAAVVHLFPSSMSVPQLLGTLRGLTYRPREVGGVPRHLPDAFAHANLAPTPLETLRQGLTELIAEDRRWDTAAYRLRSTRQTLSGALLRVCELQVKDHAPPEPLGESIALSLQQSRDEDYVDDNSKPLRALLETAPVTLRRAVFWAQERLLTAVMTGMDAEDRVVRMMWSPSLPIDEARDGPWLRADLADGQRPLAQRRVALECLIFLAHGKPDRVATLQAWRPHVADAPDLAARLEELIAAYANPAPRDRWFAEEAERKEVRRRKELKARASWIGFCRELLDDSAGRMDADRDANTALNLTIVMSKVAGEGRHIGWNRGFLERVFDKPRVERLRQIMMGRWRLICALLPTELADEERHSVYSNWRVQMAGLFAEAEQPQWTRRLSQGEAQQAMRYALTSIDGLPGWVTDLAQVHPDVVRDLMRPELEAQLNDTDPRSDHSSLLQYIGQAGPSVVALSLEPLQAWLARALDANENTIRRSSKLERAVELLLTHGTPGDADLIRAAALGEVQSAHTPEALLFWLPWLLRLAPDQGVGEIERLASEVEPAAQSLVTQSLSVLFGHRGRGDAFTAALLERPDLLLRLALLAYRHIRTDDDQPRDSERDSNTRDDAEWARNALVSALLKAKGPEAWSAKLEFAQHELTVHFKDRIQIVATQGMAEEWDTPLYQLSDVLNLERGLELAPVTRADMAMLLLDRLDQLADRLREDTSPRQMWSALVDETLLRRAVAAEFQALAHGAYTVTMESATGEEKETDIRFHSNGYAIEAVIELKVGENDYSVPDLLHALRFQLVGQYMAPENRRVGCLLISIASNRQWKHPDDGRMIEIEDVIALLQTEAKGIVAGLDGESLLEVRALDLRSPLPTSKKKKKTPRRSRGGPGASAPTRS